MRTMLKTAAVHLAAIAAIALPAAPAFASGHSSHWSPWAPVVTASVNASVKQNQMAWTDNMVDMKQSAMIDIVGPHDLRAWAGGEQQLWGQGRGDYGQNQEVNASLAFTQQAPTWQPWWGWSPWLTPKLQTAVNVLVDVQSLFGF